MTCRDFLVGGGGMRLVGAMEVFGRTFVCGTRREDAAEGGGRSGAPLVSRGGVGRDPIVGGFSRGGLLERVVGGCMLEADGDAVEDPLWSFLSRGGVPILLAGLFSTVDTSKVGVATGTPFVVCAGTVNLWVSFCSTNFLFVVEHALLFDESSRVKLLWMMAHAISQNPMVNTQPICASG